MRGGHRFPIADQIIFLVTQKDILKDIANPSENPYICIAETVLEQANSLLHDYNSVEKRKRLLQAISVDLPNFLNDK